MNRPIRVGTSGWHYDHWRGVFYPKELKTSEMLRFCSSRFASIEINNSFYRLPAKKTFSQWRKLTPGDFLFAVKASRYITHAKRLKDPKRSTQRLFSAAAGLGPQLGPFLFQLPPRWRRDCDRLQNFLAALPSGRRYAFEFRDPAWFHPEIYDVLKMHGASLCVSDLAGHQSPRIITAPFVYMRLHGPAMQKYCGCYTDAQLRLWLEYCHACFEQGAEEAFVYFDNDQAGYAALNAQKMLAIIDQERA